MFLPCVVRISDSSTAEPFTCSRVIGLNGLGRAYILTVHSRSRFLFSVPRPSFGYGRLCYVDPIDHVQASYHHLVLTGRSRCRERTIPTSPRSFLVTLPLLLPLVSRRFHSVTFRLAALPCALCVPVFPSPLANLAARSEGFGPASAEQDPMMKTLAPAVPPGWLLRLSDRLSDRSDFRSKISCEVGCQTKSISNDLVKKGTSNAFSKASRRTIK